MKKSTPAKKPTRAKKPPLAKKLTLPDIPTVPVKATPSELKALLRKLRDFPLEPDVDEKSLLEALSKSSTLAELLKNIYPSQAGEVFAAGALAKRNVEHQQYTVGASKIGRNSELPGDGHVGVVGDLTVQGNLYDAASLVVTGDLTVHGALSDCGPDSRVVVHGNLICDHLFTTGWILVGGDVRVKGIISEDPVSVETVQFE